VSITARYPGVCAACKQAILPGQQIEYKRGEPTKHTTCREQVTFGGKPVVDDDVPSNDECISDDTLIKGKAQYKGHEYLVLYWGPTKRGERVKLAFMDGNKQFWADASQCTLTKDYKRYGSWGITFGKLQALRAEHKGNGETSPKKRCWECGRSFTYAEAKAHDGDWQDSYCGC